MSVIFVALPVALLMGAAAAWACTRCIRMGQFDDLESPPVRMLMDDRPVGKYLPIEKGGATQVEPKP